MRNRTADSELHSSTGRTAIPGMPIAQHLHSPWRRTLVSPTGSRNFVRGADDVTNRGPREPCDRYDYAARVGRRRRRDVEGALLGGSDVHEVAEQVVSSVLGPAEAFHGIGPDVNDRAISHGD